MFTIEITNLNNVREAFLKAPLVVDKELQSGVKNAGAKLLEIEKKEVPVNTGNLRRNIAFKYEPISAMVYPVPKYAVYVHEGTGLYGYRHDFIRPVKAKALAFKVKGKLVFAKKVRGMKANPFVERTADKGRLPLNRIFDDILNNIIDKI